MSEKKYKWEWGGIWQDGSYKDFIRFAKDVLQLKEVSEWNQK